MPIMDKVKELGTVLMGNVESGSVHKVDNLLVMPNKVRVVAIYYDEARFRSSGTGENLRVRVSRIKIEDIRSGFVLSSIDITPIPLVQKFIAQLQILELEDLVRHGYNVNGNYSSGFSEPLEEDMAICLDEDDPMKQSHKEEELRNVNAGDHDHRDSEFPRKSFEDLEIKFESTVIVYNYTKGIKAFYMKLNEDQKTVVAAMNVLVPKVWIPYYLENLISLILRRNWISRVNTVTKLNVKTEILEEIFESPNLDRDIMLGVSCRLALVQNVTRHKTKNLSITFDDMEGVDAAKAELLEFEMKLYTNGCCHSSRMKNGGRTEIDALSHYTEVVPGTRFPPTATTVSSTLLLGISSLPDTTFNTVFSRTNIAFRKAINKERVPHVSGCNKSDKGDTLLIVSKICSRKVERLENIQPLAVKLKVVAKPLGKMFLIIFNVISFANIKPIRRIQDFEELKDHFLTLKNTSYPHQQYAVCNTLVNEEEQAGFTQYAVSIKKIWRIRAYTSPDTTKNSSSIRRIQDPLYVVKMDDPNITMEEYIRLKEEKARRRAIVFNDTLTSEATLSCEPTVSSLNNDEIEFRISFDESDDEDCTIIFDKNSFSYKIISVNDLKTDSENDIDRVNMPLLPSPEPTVSYFDDLDYFKDFEKEFPAIVYNDAQTSKLDFLTEPTLSPQHIDEFNLKDETSLSECDEEEQNFLNFNDLFPFNVIYPNDSKSDKDNDDDKIDIEHSSGDLSVKPLPDVINVGAYAHGSNKLLETSHDTSNKFSKLKLLSKD
ncbi:uncharacterized mitochondrial protein-like protein [Tanacetum coccineum]